MYLFTKAPGSSAVEGSGYSLEFGFLTGTNFTFSHLKPLDNAD
jgi:hypothetical protein